MKYANIVHNNSPYSGVIYVGGGSPQMQYCIFHKNLYTLINVETGSLDISHSFISHNGAFSTSIPVSTGNNNSFVIRQSFFLTFFHSYYCPTDISIKQQATMNLIDTSYKS